MPGKAAVLTCVATLGLAALVPVNAQAAGTASNDACHVRLGYVTPAGTHRSLDTYATIPPTIQVETFQVNLTGDLYQPGQIRLSARQTDEPTPEGAQHSGYVVAGDALFWNVYLTDPYGQVTNPPTLRRIGGGWNNFTSLEVSEYQAPPPGKVHRQAAYALRNDGTLYRWRIDNGTWHAAGSYPGFAAVKSMALIAKTPTYDTFVANTRGGGLYTIRIMAGSGAPIVKQVRTRTWQAFETLSAMACGQNGSLLLGIDRDTRQAYLYAVGHANGLSTVIQSHGQVHGTFDDPVNFRWVTVPVYDTANGE
jgi:hypothetical protein